MIVLIQPQPATRVDGGRTANTYWSRLLKEFQQTSDGGGVAEGEQEGCNGLEGGAPLATRSFYYLSR